MQLKSSQKKSRLLSVARKIWYKRAYLIIGALLYTFLIFVYGAYKKNFILNILIPSVKENIGLIPNVVAGIQANPEHITIDIKHKDFQKLAHKRNIAWSKGLLITSSDDYVPAKIRYQNKTIKVKIRLKGDNIDHLEGDKWSYRVKIKGEDTLFGMKIFSLQHPKTRSYIYEWIFHQALVRENILSPRYKFVNVDINGKDFGIYALEEHFEKRLLEYSQRKEGPIIKFNENLFWEEILQQGKRLRRSKRIGSGSFFSSHVDAFQTNKILSDSLSYKSYLKSINLLEAFRKGILKTSDVFDVPKLAKYFAIVDLMGAWHGSQWFNKRFYYNPVTSFLEPIGFDGYFEGGGKNPIKFLIAKLPSLGGIHDNKYLPLIFEDMNFYREYTKALVRMCEPPYLDKMFLDLKDELRQNLSIIHRQYPFFHFSEGGFRQNQRYIKNILNPVKGMHAYLHRVSENHIELELGNIQSMPIEGFNISYGDSIIFQHRQEIILKALNPQNPVQYRDFSFIFPHGFVWSDTMISDLKVNYRILGTTRQRYVNVYRRSQPDNNCFENDLFRQKPNIQLVDFFITNESTKKILINPGVWSFDQDLIIPKGYKVICKEGTQLNLLNSSKILSYSPLEFIGSEDYPIVIQSTDSTGQGIIVMNANETSVLEYVTFTNLSNPSQGGWELTGAVTFYESPVNISHCQFTGNRAEDGLNIIRSDFTIDKTLFSQTSSDAFDADFTKGKITHSSFIDCGNDAVDVSGSVVEVRDVFINGVGDKGLSAGENSQMTVNEVEIRNAEIAIASKDMSEININGLSIADSKIGFTVFQKKSEFGPGLMTANMVSVETTTIAYLVEEGSILLVNGEKIKSSRENVKEILYGVEYGKSSQ